MFRVTGFLAWVVVALSVVGGVTVGAWLKDLIF